MKLPRLLDKFVIINEASCLYGNVVSGVHLDVRADEDDPDRLWYYVRVDRAYEGDVVSSYGGYVSASLTLEGALEYVSHYLTPYHEQEEKPDEEPAAAAVDSSDEEIISGKDGENELSGVVPDNSGVENPFCPSGSDNAGNSSDQMPREDVIPEAAAALDHVFNRFNSLAADLLHMQHILTPAQSGTGGAAYA